MSLAKKITGFITIALVLLGIAAFCIPIPSNPLLSLILRAVGMFFISSGSMWLLYLPVQEDYEDEMNGFLKVLCLIGAFIIFGVGIGLYMFSTNAQISDGFLSFFAIKGFEDIPHHDVIVLATSLAYVGNGILGLIFSLINRNDVDYIHSNFLISKEAQHVITWASPYAIFLLFIFSWIVGCCINFFGSLCLPEWIFFILSCAGLGFGIYFYFFYQNDDFKMLLDMRFVGTACLYLAAIFPAVLFILDFTYENVPESYYWVGWLYIPTLLGVAVSAFFLEHGITIEALKAQGPDVVNEFNNLLAMYRSFILVYAIGSIISFLATPAFKPFLRLHWGIKLSLAVLLAPLWALVAAIYDFFEYWASKAD